MTQANNPAAAQDAQGGGKSKEQLRLRCTLATVEAGLINGIRFAAVDGGLYSEPLDAHEEQAARLQAVGTYELETVSGKLAREIDQACALQKQAERAVPQAASPADDQALAEQQQINGVLHKELGAERDKVRVLTEKLAAADTKQLEADVTAKAKRIAELGEDYARVQADNVRLTEELKAATEELGIARAANEALKKQQTATN